MSWLPARLRSRVPEHDAAWSDPRGGRWVVVGMAAAAVLLLGLAGVFAYQHAQLASATDNSALIDAASTAEVADEIGAAIEAVLSYDHNAIEETEQAAEELLVGDEVRQTYDSLYGEVQRVAPEQQMVLTTEVSRLAVVELEDDHARVLAFVDQTATREGEADSNVGGSQLAVTAERHDGAWKIADLDTYTDPSAGEPPATGPPAPGGNDEAPLPEDGE